MNDMPPPSAGKKAFIKSYGCQMNVYDSERMGEILAEAGYGVAVEPEDADLVILNTCHIREKASEKIYSELGKMREARAGRQARGADTVIAVAGCVAQAEGEELVRRAKGVDLVFGPQTLQRLPDYLARHRATGKPVIETEFPSAEKFAALAKRLPNTRGATAFLTVQEGCDKFCSFCVVPYTRGGETSRAVADVMAEARALVAGGVREVTLLGQNVNAYRGSRPDGTRTGLAGLIRDLSGIDGLLRIRYTTSHPLDMDQELMAAHAVNEKLMPYLHLPIQSGSDRILKAMNRGHTVETYHRIIKGMREVRGDMAISGDFIVGFPGETEEDFAATLRVVREVGYASAYSFKYSARPGTPAAERKGQVPEDVKEERLARLQAALAETSAAFNAACVGRTLPVLVEKAGRQPGQVIGRSPYLQSVHLDFGEAPLGQLVDAHILAVGPNSLSGQYAGSIA
ncbi:MAG: tRNA (N6-isopentenyl adenosine(37)-C2)-methylthiotransferase MiaB [Hyphomicrobiales bacterium]